MRNELIEEHVKRHLDWYFTPISPEKDKKLEYVRAARNKLKGKEVQESERRIQERKAQMRGAVPPAQKIAGGPTEVESRPLSPVTEGPMAAKEKVKAKKEKKAKKERARVQGSVIDPTKRKEYEKSNVKTASGARSVSTGDAVAKALNGLTVEQLAQVAKRGELTDRFVGWKHLNPGMQRMNLGNVLRAQIKAGDAKAKATVAEAAKMDRAFVEAKKSKAKAEKKAKPKVEKAENAA